MMDEARSLDPQVLVDENPKAELVGRARDAGIEVGSDIAGKIVEGAPALQTPEDHIAPLETRESPAQGVCLRCDAHSADHFDGPDGPYCGTGCLELARRGL